MSATKRAGRPPRGHVKLTCCVPKDFADAVRDEAARRGKTLGELMQEAFDSRITVYTAH
jgi:ferredoxin-NADP reductase